MTTSTDTRSFGRYKNELEMLEYDVRNEWEQYSLEAMHVCGKMTKRLAGKPIGFKHRGTTLHGKILKFTDLCGSVNIEVQMSEGCCEVDTRDVVYIGRRPKA